MPTCAQLLRRNMRWIVGVINSQAKGHYLGGWSHWVLLLVPEERFTLPVAVNRAGHRGEAGPANSGSRRDQSGNVQVERREGRKEVKVEREKHGGDWEERVGKTQVKARV